MSVEAVDRFLADGFASIDGWASPLILQVAGRLGAEMNAIGVSGGACEIGVHEGKFLIGLVHVVDLRPSVAIDVFDAQDLNIDHSGGGKVDLLARFRRNVSKHAGGATIGELQGDSLALGAADSAALLDRYGAFQFISIDGGHEPEHVVSDYRFAESIIHAGGVIIIDDIQNPGFPGVMEGVATLFLLGRPKFVPLAIGHNKLFLASKTYHRRYLEFMFGPLTHQLPTITLWRKSLFGHEVACII